MAELLTIVGGMIPIAVIAYFVSFGVRSESAVVRQALSITIASLVAVCLGAFGFSDAITPTASDWGYSAVVYMTSGFLYLLIRIAILRGKGS
jgi:hypothetical protein